MGEESGFVPMCAKEKRLVSWISNGKTVCDILGYQKFRYELVSHILGVLRKCVAHTPSGMSSVPLLFESMFMVDARNAHELNIGHNDSCSLCLKNVLWYAFAAGWVSLKANGEDFFDCPAMDEYYRVWNCHGLSDMWLGRVGYSLWHPRLIDYERDLLQIMDFDAYNLPTSCAFYQYFMVCIEHRLSRPETRHQKCRAIFSLYLLCLTLVLPSIHLLFFPSDIALAVCALFLRFNNVYFYQAYEELELHMNGAKINARCVGSIILALLEAIRANPIAKFYDISKHFTSRLYIIRECITIYSESAHMMIRELESGPQLSTEVVSPNV